MLARTFHLGVVPLVTLIACSSEQRTAPPDPEGHPFTAGELAGVTDGPIGSPVSTSGTGALITGIAGHFTRLSYRGATGSNTSYIYYAARPADPVVPSRFHIFRLAVNGGAPQQLTFDTLGQTFPSVSPDGSRIAYFQSDGSLSHTAYYYTYLMQADGSGKRIVAGAADIFEPAVWSLQGDSLIYPNGVNDPADQGIYQYAISPPGLGIRLRVTTGDDHQPTIGILQGRPTLVYVRRDSLMQTDLTLRDSSLYYAGGGLRFTNPKLSPDSRRILFWRYDQGGSVTLQMAPADFPSASRIVADAGINTPPDPRWQPYAEWLPDGSGIVASLPSGDSAGTFQFYQLDTTGFGNHRLITRLSHSLRAGFSIGRAAAVHNRDLLGTGAPMGPAASGIVFGQQTGGAIASVLAYSALTQDSVQLESLTGMNSTSPVLSFSLRTDRLTRLTFLNDLTAPPIVVIDSGAGQSPNGAIITFDATNGQVALVLPYSVQPGESFPTMEDRGALRTFRGHFTAAYGPDGINQARGRIAGVTLDMRSRSIQIMP